jgi:heat shock protein beta
LNACARQTNNAIVVISNRLVTSPCAIVADSHGYTANIQRMMSAQNAQNQPQSYMHEFAKKAKVLEINPRSPLIEGLLRRVEQLPEDGEEPDAEAEAELNEVASILIDGALVRSGFEVTDSNMCVPFVGATCICSYRATASSPALTVS